VVAILWQLSPIKGYKFFKAAKGSCRKFSIMNNETRDVKDGIEIIDNPDAIYPEESVVLVITRG
jgi:hypothetical protein